jgi:taurine dioxygenase
MRCRKPAGGHHAEAGAELLTGFGVDGPRVARLVERGGADTGRESDVAAEVVAVGDVVQVPLDLGLGGELFAPHPLLFELGIEPERVLEARDVAPRPRVAIPVPRTAHGRSPLEDDDPEPPLSQHLQGVEPRHAGPHDHDVRVQLDVRRPHDHSLDRTLCAEPSGPEGEHRPRRLRLFAIRPVAPACGAELAGIDLRRVTPDQLALVAAALSRHHVVFFRDQDLSPADQVELTARFGTVLRVPYIESMADHPEVIAVLKEAEERNISTFGGTWHSDFSFLPEPPSLTLLFGVDIPPFGGDTIWANQTAAYAALSPAMQRLLDPLGAVHTGWPHGTRGPGANAAVSRSIGMVRNDPTADREVIHPVVRVHPVTGEHALFVNPVYTQRFDGMTEAESAALLAFLFQHAVRPEFTCRFRWTAGALAIWDNRSLLHLALNDYDGSRRLLHRTTVAGDRPTGPTG